jgi:dTDP-4-amino-4,6-dideoxygalactose transaminase
VNIPISQPTVPELSGFVRHLKKIFKSRQLTNGAFVKQFEERLKEYLGVKEVVCVSSATSGLMLSLQAYGLQGEVLVPSYTFPATTHSLVWNDLKPVFVECDPRTFNIDFEDVERKVTPRTSAIMGVHVFGNPIDMQRLMILARKHKLKVIIDGAHALGSLYRGKHVGHYGDVTVFSLAPTKLVTSAEGGIIVTDDRRLAEALRLARNYGNPLDYNCKVIGFNARLSEIHAALGIESFKHLESYIAKRNALVLIYKKQLAGIPGFYFQQIDSRDRSTFNYCSIFVDAKESGVNCARLHDALLPLGIHTKRYFYPAVHMQDAYRPYLGGTDLPVTEIVSNSVICPPLFSHMKKDTVIKICDIIKKIVSKPQKKKGKA